jgi:hypothetical protein
MNVLLNMDQINIWILRLFPNDEGNPMIGEQLSEYVTIIFFSVITSKTLTIVYFYI